jgi:hypothetical protein
MGGGGVRPRLVRVVMNSQAVHQSDLARCSSGQLITVEELLHCHRRHGRLASSPIAHLLIFGRDQFRRRVFWERESLRLLKVVATICNSTPRDFRKISSTQNLGTVNQVPTNIKANMSVSFISILKKVGTYEDCIPIEPKTRIY